MRKRKIRRYSNNRQQSLFLFLRYISIGGFLVSVDLGVFKFLLLKEFSRPFSATVAYAIAVALQFLLNKYFNFKNFERSAASQIKTYLAVIFCCWLVTISIIEICVRFLNLIPLLGKLVAILVNIPLSFYCHRYLTFGQGIRAVIRQLWMQISKH